MNTALKVGGAVAVVLALLAGGIALGFALAGGFSPTSRLAWSGSGWMMGYDNGWRGSMMAGQYGGMMGRRYGGHGMMGGYVPDRSLAPDTGESLTLAQAVEVAETHIADTGDDLELAEVMAFDNHFYAEARETETGISAFEFLIDPLTSAVYPEPGPNMMWNLKYGMMSGYGGQNAYGGYGMMGRGMMGGYTATDPDTQMTVSPEEARELAQAALDSSLPGTIVADEFDTFYGYYTLHYERDGETAGMLSVNGFTGQAWLHTWHGTFVGMVEHE